LKANDIAHELLKPEFEVSRQDIFRLAQEYIQLTKGNRTVRRGDVYRLDSNVVVCVEEQPNSQRPGVNCMVIGGTNSVYPKGGCDIFVFFTALHEAEKIEVV